MYHAEVVAHRVGEPFGTLVLALAITVIEASLIVSLMLAGGEATMELARDTLFSAVMIICNGVVGLCLLVGALRYGEQEFRVQGASAAFAVLIALATLTLVLPVFTTSTLGGTFSVPQLTFAGIASLALYGVFVFVQTIKHRDYFLPPGGTSPEAHAQPPTPRRAWLSFGLLFVCLLGVVGLAKLLAPTVELAVAAAQAPHAVVGIAIALLVLGLSAKEVVLLALTFVVGTLTLGTGRTNLLQGAVHLMIFAAFLFLSLFP